MSLTVSPDLLDQARHGDVDDAAFTACIQASLPYAWQLVSELAGPLRTTGTDLGTQVSGLGGIQRIRGGGHGPGLRLDRLSLRQLCPVRHDSELFKPPELREHPALK